MKNIKVKFYLLLSKLNKNKEAPVYIRVVLGGKSFNFSSGIFVNPDFWDQGRKIVRSKHTEAIRLNNLLNASRNLIMDTHYDLLKQGTLSLQTLRDKLKQKDSTDPTLMDLIDYCIGETEKEVGKTCTRSTWVRYKSFKSIMKDYLMKSLKRQDIDLNLIDLAFITKLKHYLAFKKNNAPGTIGDVMRRFKKVINDGIRQDWIKENPFKNFTIAQYNANRQYLTMDEVSDLENLKNLKPSLERARDVFVFVCYTGLSYSDLRNLKSSDILLGIDGNRVIQTNRKKTTTECKIPLLPKAAEIWEKYKNHSICLSRGTCVPVTANYKFNLLLKQLAVSAKITKPITCHIGRHTFATMSLEMGVPMETVSKVLGHKNIKTTQIYGKITNKKITDDYKQFYTLKTTTNGSSDERRLTSVEG